MQNHNMHMLELVLVRPERIFKATLCCCIFSCKTDYDEVIPYLHEQERNYYHTLKFERRIKSYLMGRFTAKQAVAALTGETKLTNIAIQSGIFTQPIVTANKQNIQVSITHCDDLGAALAFPEAHPMGIDLEKMDANKNDVLHSQITAAEEIQISACTFSDTAGLTLLWTVKEALSKVFKTGLTTPFEVFEISEIQCCDHYIICYYKNFTQYKAISFTIGDYMCSIVHPVKSKVYFDLQSIKAKFAFIDAVSEVAGTVS